MNITIQCKMAWNAKLCVYQFLLYTMYTIRTMFTIYTVFTIYTRYARYTMYIRYTRYARTLGTPDTPHAPWTPYTPGIPYKPSRGKSGVRRNLVVALNIQWTSFPVTSEFQMTTREHGFSLKSGFWKIRWPQIMVLVFNLVSRKYCVHQTFLYTLYPRYSRYTRFPLHLWVSLHQVGLGRFPPFRRLGWVDHLLELVLADH